MLLHIASRRREAGDFKSEAYYNRQAMIINKAVEEAIEDGQDYVTVESLSEAQHKTKEHSTLKA